MNKLTAIKITGLTVLVAAAGTASAVSRLESQPQAEARKELVYIGMPAESERPPYPPLDENITRQTSGVTEVKVGTTSFLVYGTGGYSIAIDFKTLKVVSYMPVGSTVVTDNDPAPGAKVLGDKYNMPLEKVLSGEAGFEKKDAPNWSDSEREKILSEGLAAYMARIAHEEAEAGAAAEAARPKDIRSDHMWIPKGKNP